MARPLRIELAGGHYHVMNRGNNRQDIFLTDKDRHINNSTRDDALHIFETPVESYLQQVRYANSIG